MITVFSQPTCGQCRAVKMLLKQKGIEYVAVEDIEKMKSLGISHTPAILIPTGEILTGPKIIEWIRNYGN